MSGDNRAHASRQQSAGAPARLPGAWTAALIAAVSALIAGAVARPGETADPAASAGASRMAEVTPDQIDAALETVAGSGEQIATFREREACRRKLAWVTVSRLPGRPAGRIRLQSGKYISPAFELTDVPVRVALPYPAPYPSGRGTISVVGTTSDAAVALTPSWQVLARQGFQSHEVTWTPVRCAAANRPPD